MDMLPCSTPLARAKNASTPRLRLDERQRRLVLLLLAGHTDASAAIELGVSPRTVTNILRNLMNRLGVDNRFQLGVALGAHLLATHSTRESTEPENRSTSRKDRRVPP